MADESWSMSSSRLQSSPYVADERSKVNLSFLLAFLQEGLPQTGLRLLNNENVAKRTEVTHRMQCASGKFA